MVIVSFKSKTSVRELEFSTFKEAFKHLYNQEIFFLDETITITYRSK